MKKQNKLFLLVSEKLKGDLFKNSFWGVFSNIFQNILFSVFFIVVARKYSTDDFANYVIANTLYSFVVGFSSLGLGQWFIRELMHTEDKTTLINKFFKIQLIIGFVFYGVNILMAYALYDNQLIRNLSLLIGINVIFDNIIYVIKFINIAQFEQRKTFIILTIEALLKFLIAGLLFVYPISILYLSVFLIALRLITLNLFIRMGSSNLINLKQILRVKINVPEVKAIIGNNWAFIIIGSISVVYWRIGNILVSKILTLTDVANYEVSYKLFSMAEILPVIVSSSIYPLLINAYKEGTAQMHALYRRAFLGYALYGLMAYTFIYSFSDIIIPLLFGEKYLLTPVFCNQMFLTILVFPTALLQANVLVTMKLEKLDMWCNVVSLVINLSLCFIGFYYVEKDLSIVNYAIFFSFIAFHIIQDVVMVRRKITSLFHVSGFYIISTIAVFGYISAAGYVNRYLLFICFWAIVLTIVGYYILKDIQKKKALAALFINAE